MRGEQRNGHRLLGLWDTQRVKEENNSQRLSFPAVYRFITDNEIEEINFGRAVMKRGRL